jgi:hypothetical protein
VIGRENQKSAALARVDSSRSDIFDGHLPAIHDAAIQSTTFAGRWTSSTIGPASMVLKNGIA